MNIFKEQVEFIRTPKSFLLRLSIEDRKPLIGLRHILMIGFLYEIAIILWAFGAESLTLPAFLKIQENQYYFYELAFLIPLFLLIWLIASSTAYIISRQMGGSGTFDSILNGFGLTMAVSAYFTLIPDYIQGILWTTGWVPFNTYQEITGRGIFLVMVWSYLLAYILSHLYLYLLTIHTTQGLSKTRSSLVALVSFMSSFSLWIVFIR
jgi:hypothetical protein